jgi:HK97 gp10 family phage protein
MARNESVERFRRLTVKMQNEIAEAAISELHVQGDRLAKMIEAVAPRGETGDLIHSIRQIPGSRPTQIRIVAGSPQTVKAGYQYPRADEFGTVHMQAKPFFFPTYRLMKKRIIAAMKRKITDNIKKHSAE